METGLTNERLEGAAGSFSPATLSIGPILSGLLALVRCPNHGGKAQKSGALIYVFIAT
jgi:hypothetical protein